MYFLFLLLIKTLYIIQTENNALHFSNNETVFISSLIPQTPVLNPPDSHITNAGMLVLPSLEIQLSEIIDKPFIHKRFIYKANKKIYTHNIQGITIFICVVEVSIYNTITHDERLMNFSYVYYPFTKKLNIDITTYSVTIDQKFYTFDSPIVAVYACVEYHGSRYMARIYANTDILAYIEPNLAPQSNLRFRFMVAAFSLIPIVYYFGHSKFLVLERKLVAYDGFTYHEGLMKKRKVIVKIYKKFDKRFNHEVETLNKLHHTHLVKHIYSESRFWNNAIILEYCYIGRLNLQHCKQLVDAIDFLHTNKVWHGALCPSSIRLRNDTVAVCDMHSSGLKCAGQVGWRPIELIRNTRIKYDVNSDMYYKVDVFALGCLIHYYLIGVHPYDLNTSEGLNSKMCEHNVGCVTNSVSRERGITDDHDTRKCIVDNLKPRMEANEAMTSSMVEKQDVTPVKSKSGEFSVLKTYTPEELDGIENSILCQHYNIRLKNQTMHDLIYHTIKPVYIDRTATHNLAMHPAFWSADRKFMFLAHLSDIYEHSPGLSRRLERNKARIFVGSWNQYLNPEIELDLQIFRVYNYNTARDLLRAIRNKGRHYKELPFCLKKIYGSFPEGFVGYWMDVFPGLLMVCYICADGFKNEELISDFY